MRPIAIYYEHPDWFRPLFAELDRRGVPWVALNAASHAYDTAERDPPYSLVFNRASPSAYLRGSGQSTFYTLQWLRHLERRGVPVVNGSRVYEVEISKARQIELLDELGIGHPRTRVANSARSVVEAARGLRWPVLVKANVGGSGAGIARFDDLDRLVAAAEKGSLAFGPDGVALVQELAPLRGDHISRVEVLGAKVLYGIRVFPEPGSFNLCPADACQTNGGVELARAACPVDAPKNGLRVEAFDPPAHIADTVLRIAARAGLDVGGVEYLVDARDGRESFYDVNALSNFVADGPRVVGFDPFVRLVDELVARAGARGA